MIPNIALMIGAYIGFRMLEVIARSNSTYINKGSAIAVKVLAFLTFLVSGVACVSTLWSGTNVPR
jgi:dolichyl-phosphate-mannose--protein O-mannosyl transferase